MICSLEDIRSKEVIDILTGERLGYIDDVRINLETSDVLEFVVYGSERFFGIFGKDEDIVIPCEDIEVIGQDVLLIKRSQKLKMTRATKNRRFSFESLFK